MVKKGCEASAAALPARQMEFCHMLVYVTCEMVVA